jgi:hypothetical protein
VKRENGTSLPYVALALPLIDDPLRPWRAFLCPAEPRFVGTHTAWRVGTEWRTLAVAGVWSFYTQQVRSPYY